MITPESDLKFKAICLISIHYKYQSVTTVKKLWVITIFAVAMEYRGSAEVVYLREAATLSMHAAAGHPS